MSDGTQSTDKIPAKFRKTKSGKWAVMGPIDDLEKALAEGGKVEVLKKSGDWSSFRVFSLGKPFDVDGVQMCYGYGPDEEGDGQTGSGGGSSSGQAGGGNHRGPDRPPSTPSAPAGDPSEPMPEYQGGPEDEWGDF